MVLATAATAWAGEIPAQAGTGYVVTQEQFGIVIVIGAVITLIPVIDACKRWFGKPQKRDIQQPLQVEAAPKYAPLDHTHPLHLTREQYDEIAKGCRADRRSIYEAMKADREAQSRQLDFLGQSIRAELKEHNKDAIDRAEMLHGRISVLLGPIEATRDRLADHINDKRAHAKGET